MALKTRCMTPGALYSTRITAGDTLHVTVAVPSGVFDISEAEAEHLEAVVHNALEMALAPLFQVQRDSGLT